MGLVKKDSIERYCDRCGVVEDELDSARDGSIYQVAGAGVKRDICAECLRSWRKKEFLLTAFNHYETADAKLAAEKAAEEAKGDLGQQLRGPNGEYICSVAGCPKEVKRWEVPPDILGFCEDHGLFMMIDPN